MTKAAAVLGVSLLLLGAAAPSQSQFEAQVLQYLDQAAEAAISSGYDRALDTLTGSLADSASDGRSLNLAAGNYVILGVCDEDCGDVDLVLYDSHDNEIAADREPDDFPVLEFSTGGGAHRLSVEMYDCSTDPCYWAVRVYGGGSGAGASDPGEDPAEPPANTDSGRWVLTDTEYFIGKWQSDPPYEWEHYNLTALDTGLNHYFENRRFGSEFECNGTWEADHRLSGLGTLPAGHDLEMPVELRVAVAQNYPNGHCSLDADLNKERVDVGYAGGDRLDLFAAQPEPTVDPEERNYQGVGRARVPNGGPGETLYLRIALSPGNIAGSVGVYFVYRWLE